MIDYESIQRYSSRQHQDMGRQYPTPTLPSMSTSLSNSKPRHYLAKQAPSQPPHLRLKLVFLRLPSIPQVPTPQAGIQTPHPDVLAFDSNALGSICGSWQVPGRERHQERVGAETLSFEPQDHHPPNHTWLTDREAEVNKKYQDGALRKQPSQHLNLGLQLPET